MSITTDRLASYPKAIPRLQSEGLLPKDVALDIEILNNIIEADMAPKCVIWWARGFQRMKTASTPSGASRSWHDPTRSLQPQPSGVQAKSVW